MARQRTNAEQQAMRASAPRPTAAEEVKRLAPDGIMTADEVLNEVIGTKQIEEATQTLLKYKAGKASLEKRVIDNEQWYKLRHWESMRRENEKTTKEEPTSAWLFNCIASKHAEAMDNFPSPNILPREEMDTEQAKMLTSIIPVVLEQNDFESTYDEAWLDKLKAGTGIYMPYWDTRKHNIGDISIACVDILSLFWESGITDIQASRNVFQTELVDNDILLGEYPQLKGHLSSKTINVSEYVYDDSVDTSNKSVVVDWYYKKRNSSGKQVLHYVKYCNDVVLYATENDHGTRDGAIMGPQAEGDISALPPSERGWYDHGLYPFVFDPLFRVKGCPAGFGYIDVGKSCQEYIDRGNEAIMKNMLVNSKPRHFIRNDGAVNEDEYANLDNDFIHVEGSIDETNIKQITSVPLASIYLETLNQKIDELKETTGNRDVLNGGSQSGVTAASSIAALQEAGSRLSRDHNKASYRAYRQIILMCIELIRQFYDLPRMFRIIGENNAQEFVMFSNAQILAQYQGVDNGIDMGWRMPLFDIEITAQKQSPYSKMAQNELALQFYNVGFFNPMMADQALTCLDMMDFDRKSTVMEKIAQNGGLYAQMVALQNQMVALGGVVDGMRGSTEVSDSLRSQFGMMPQNTEKNSMLGGSDKTGESPYTKKARQRVADSTNPN